MSRDNSICKQRMEGTIYIPVNALKDMIRDIYEEETINTDIIAWNSCLYFSLYCSHFTPSQGYNITGYVQKLSSFDIAIHNGEIILDVPGIYRVDINYNSDKQVHLLHCNKIVRSSLSCINHILKIQSKDVLILKSYGNVWDIYLNITLIDTEDNIPE